MKYALEYKSLEYQGLKQSSSDLHKPRVRPMNWAWPFSEHKMDVTGQSQEIKCVLGSETTLMTEGSWSSSHVSNKQTALHFTDN